MVTDRQVRLLMELDAKGERPETSAAKAGMDGKTARKYRRLGSFPVRPVFCRLISFSDRHAALPVPGNPHAEPPVRSALGMATL